MDTAQKLQDRLAHLSQSVRDQKDIDEIKVIQHLVELLQKENAALKKENRGLSSEKMTLDSKLKVLEQQLARLKIEGKEVAVEQDQFIEHLGVLFSRRSSGRYHPTPFCPKCHRSMKKVSPALPFTCSNCKTSTPFKASEINDVILRLQKS